MTDRQAELEKIAREFVETVLSQDVCLSETECATVQQATIDLLAAREEKVLEEVYQFVKNYHFTEVTTSAKPALRIVTDIEYWVSQQAKGRRPRKRQTQQKPEPDEPEPDEPQGWDGIK